MLIESRYCLYENEIANVTRIDKLCAKKLYEQEYALFWLWAYQIDSFSSVWMHSIWNITKSIRYF